MADLAVRTAGAQRLVVLIDGRSGSGKSTLGRALAGVLSDRAPQLVHLDDLYPGWSGLAAASAAVAGTILRPDSPGYRRYDWVAGRPAEWVPLDPDRPVIVEGAGAITAAAQQYATLTIWVAAPAAARRAAVLHRDGPAYLDWWDDWAAQENRHLIADQPAHRADVTVRADLLTTLYVTED